MIPKLCDQTINTLEDFREQLLAAKRRHKKAARVYYAMPVTWGVDQKRDDALLVLDEAAGDIMGIEHGIVLALLANGKKTTNKKPTKTRP